MSLLNKVKKNKVSLDLENYCILLRGQEKSGKTTFYADLINTFYKDPEKGLLIPFEKGYSAIDSINVFPYTILPEMSIDGVTKRGWDVFQELVKELIETKDQHGIRMVCIDTVDEFMRVATAKVIQMSIAETKKPCKSINDSFGGLTLN